MNTDQQKELADRFQVAFGLNHDEAWAIVFAILARQSLALDGAIAHILACPIK